MSSPPPVMLLVESPKDAALLRRFGLFGPPGTIFFDEQGRELPRRVISQDEAMQSPSHNGV